MNVYLVSIALLTALCALLVFVGLALAPAGHVGFAQCHVSAAGRCLSGEDERDAYDAKADYLRSGYQFGGDDGGGA